MSFSRTPEASPIALLGTSYTVGMSLASAADSGYGTQIDVLGDDTSVGDLTLYLAATVTSPTGNIDIYLDTPPTSGTTSPPSSPTVSVPVLTGTNLYRLGRVPSAKYARGRVVNNSGVAATNVSLIAVLEKAS